MRKVSGQSDYKGRPYKAAVVYRADWRGCFGEEERGVVAETESVALATVGALGPVSPHQVRGRQARGIGKGGPESG